MMAVNIPMPSPLDIEVAKRLGLRPDQVTRDHRDRLLRQLQDRLAQVPVACDREQITRAPARGAVLLFQPREAVITEAGNVRTRDVGQFAALMVQDAFHKAELQAARRKQPAPYTPGQIGIGRVYRDLFERCETSGLKLSQLGQSSGGGDGTGISEAVLDDLQYLRRLDRCIGTGTALAVRRVRPSRRGGTAARPARNITDKRLVHMFCVEGVTLSAILVAHGWSGCAENKNPLHRALCAALDRMR